MTKGTPIKVWRSYPYQEEVTVQVYDGDVLAYCNHAGAKAGIAVKEFYKFDPNIGNYDIQEYLEPAIVCDKCNAWQDRDGGEWND